MKISKDTKEWLQIIGITVFGTTAILYQQGYIFSNKDDNKVKTEKIVSVPDSTNVAPRDTVAMQTLRDAKQLKR